MNALGKSLSFSENAYVKWYAVKPQVVAKGGGYHLLKYYGGNMYALMQSVFPDFNWLPWKFLSLPLSAWKDINLVKKTVRFVETALRITEVSLLLLPHLLSFLFFFVCSSFPPSPLHNVAFPNSSSSSSTLPCTFSPYCLSYPRPTPARPSLLFFLLSLISYVARGVVSRVTEAAKRLRSHQGLREERWNRCRPSQGLPRQVPLADLFLIIILAILRL